jgi:hypothetical protein
MGGVSSFLSGFLSPLPKNLAGLTPIDLIDIDLAFQKYVKAHNISDEVASKNRKQFIEGFKKFLSDHCERVGGDIIDEVYYSPKNRKVRRIAKYHRNGTPEDIIIDIDQVKEALKRET